MNTTKTTANTELISLLETIAVERNDAITYTALLETGPVSIRKVAAASGINRGTTYEALKRLVGLGLVSVKGGDGKRDRYTAESPERIYDMIRDRRHELMEASNKAKDVVPRILAGQAQDAGRPIVRYYEGDDGIATVLRDVLQTCRQMNQPHYVAYSSPPIRQLLYRNFPQFTERRIAEDISVSVISAGEGGQEAPKSQRKWLPAVAGSQLSSYTIIYANKVATISIARDDTPYAVVIEDAGAAALQTLLFNQIWETI